MIRWITLIYGQWVLIFLYVFNLVVRFYITYNALSKKCNKNDFELYRYDEWDILKSKSGPQLEKVKKSILKLFKEHELDIIIQCNIKNVNQMIRC